MFEIIRETDKQSIEFKEEAIICYKEKKLLPRLMSGVTFQFQPAFGVCNTQTLDEIYSNGPFAFA